MVSYTDRWRRYEKIYYQVGLERTIAYWIHFKGATIDLLSQHNKRLWVTQFEGV